MSLPGSLKHAAAFPDKRLEEGLAVRYTCDTTLISPITASQTPLVLLHFVSQALLKAQLPLLPCFLCSLTRGLPRAATPTVSRTLGS